MSSKLKPVMSALYERLLARPCYQRQPLMPAFSLNPSSAAEAELTFRAHRADGDVDILLRHRASMLWSFGRRRRER